MLGWTLDGMRSGKTARQAGGAGVKDKNRRSRGLAVAPMAAALMAATWTLTGAAALSAQSCVTQSKVAPDTRAALAAMAETLGADVKANDVAKLQSLAVAEYAANFASATSLIGETSSRIGADTLTVTQLYQLDARSRKAGDSTEADFSCLLAGTTAETDFAIPALPPGLYGFAMVEAVGERPWLLSFLLRQEQGGWKMAGFYPHPRTAAGHDGVWYWNAARDDAKAKEPWRSWLMYGEADQLLRPANFVSSTNLDKLRAEERAVAPPALADGIGTETPLVVSGPAGAEYRFTGIGSEGSADGKGLNLVLHVLADTGAAAATDTATRRTRNTAAASALLNAHKELRQGFDGVIVFAESAGSAPFATEQKMAELP
jgi:hypothetical protein